MSNLPSIPDVPLELPQEIRDILDPMKEIIESVSGQGSSGSSSATIFVSNAGGGGGSGSTGTGLPSGGSAAQMLVKQSANEGDALWRPQTISIIGDVIGSGSLDTSGNIEISVEFNNSSQADFCPGYAFTRVDGNSILSVLDLNLTALFNNGRRVKISDAGVDKYGIISGQSYGVGTQIDLDMEGGATINSNPLEVCLTSSTSAWVPIATDPFGGTAINAITKGLIGATLYWVAVGAGGKLFYSTDAGVTWTAGTGFTTLEPLNDVAYDSTNQRFMAVGNNGVFLTSTNGTAWTLDTTTIPALPASGTEHVTGVTYYLTTDTFVVVWERNSSPPVYGSIYTDDFGSTWTQASTAHYSPWIQSANRFGLEVLVGSTQSDFEDIGFFDSNTDPTPSSHLSTTGENDSLCYAFKDNGDSTETCVIGRASGHLSIFAAIGSTQVIDDVTFSQDINAIVYSTTHDRFVCVTNNGGIGYIDSADFATADAWTSVSNGFSPTTNINDIAYDDSSPLFVAVAANGQICRSTNGIT